MIVAMKKIAVIVPSGEANISIEHLANLGMLHVEHQKAPQGKEIHTLGEEITLVSEAIKILSLPEFKKVPLADCRETPSDWRFAAKHVVDLFKRLAHLEDFSRTLLNQIEDWRVWGDFEPKAIEALKAKDILVRLYQVPVKEITKIPKELIVQKLFTKASIAYCAVISRQKIEIPFKEIIAPKISLEQMRLRLFKDQQAIEEITHQLHAQLCYRSSLIDIREKIIKELEFYEALYGMGDVTHIRYISGYVPYDAVTPLKKAAKQYGWALMVQDPAQTDIVPTLVRNPRWISIINPVFRLIEVVPGYQELDISFWFLIFFSIFFGMLVGDAGIGVVFVIATFTAQKKLAFKIKDKSIFILFYILSLCAIIWGVLTGTFFGQAWLPKQIQPLIPALRDDKNVQTFCFFLGAVHLSIAHTWRFLIKLPALAALSDIGWISVLWGGFFLARLLILGEILPFFTPWLFIIGSILVVLFSNPQKNIFKGIGSGLSTLLLNAVNSFTDIVSYIRLFAVGLASVAVADSFNAMALSIGYNSVLTGIATTLILVLGQALNAVLGPMSVLVHGLRLNVLEFCSHLDIKWSGFMYKPLKR